MSMMPPREIQHRLEAYSPKCPEEEFCELRLYGETRPDQLPKPWGHLQSGGYHGGKGCGEQPPRTAVQVVLHGGLVEEGRTERHP